MTTESAHADTAAMLVAANHILYAHGIVDAFGHVSVRDPQRSGRFLIARNMAPKQVGPRDIMSIELDGTYDVDDEKRPYLERFIHGSIYRQRPDVGAIVHSHAVATIPFGVVRGLRLRPLWHMSSFLGENVPLFEIRDVAGDESDMLVRNFALGEALAAKLGAAAAVMMRGHGCTVVGKDIREAVFRAIYTAENARVQLMSMQLGDVTYLNPSEALNSTASNAGQIDRAWALWMTEAGP